MATLTVQTDGKDSQIEVPDEAIEAAGFLPKKRVESEYVAKSYHASEISRVSERFKGSARDEIKGELEKDEAFIQGILKAHGKSQVDLQAHRQQWEKETLSPVVQERDMFKRMALRGVILDAATDIRDEYLKPFGSKPSYLETLLADQIRFDAEHGPIATDAKGNPLPGSEGRTYASPKDLIGRLREDAAFKYLFKEQEPQKGSGYKGSNGQGGTKTIGRADFEALSPVSQREFLKGGGKVTD